MNARDNLHFEVTKLRSDLSKAKNVLNKPNIQPEYRWRKKGSVYIRGNFSVKPTQKLEK